MSEVTAFKKSEKLSEDITKITEDEIRPDDVFEAFLSLCAEDAESFFRADDFMDVACPGCASADVEDHFVKHAFKYNHCGSCGSLYVSPRPTPAAMERYYRDSKSQLFWFEEVLKKTGKQRKAKIMLPNVNRVGGILESLGAKPACALDVGSANGAFLTEWQKQHPDTKLLGIEPGPESAQKCRDLGITVFEGMVEDEAAKPEVEGDLVTCFEVIEHVQNMDRFAKAMYDVTAKDGVAILSGLGADGFDIQILWEKSRSLMPPHHLNFLSIKGMKTLFSKVGFKKVDVITPGRLDVQIVKKSIERGVVPTRMSHFEKLLLSKDQEVLDALQKFLADNKLSSHVWLICQK